MCDPRLRRRPCGIGRPPTTHRKLQSEWHLHVSARDRSPVLAGLLHAGVVALGIGDDPRLGVAVERNPARFAEDFLTAGAQMDRQGVGNRHRFSFRGEPDRKGGTISGKASSWPKKGLAMIQ